MHLVCSNAVIFAHFNKINNTKYSHYDNKNCRCTNCKMRASTPYWTVLSQIKACPNNKTKQQQRNDNHVPWDKHAYIRQQSYP